MKDLGINFATISNKDTTKTGSLRAVNYSILLLNNCQVSLTVRTVKDTVKPVMCTSSVHFKFCIFFTISE